MRNQRRLAEESAECTDTTIQLQVGECVRNVCGMTESHNTAGHRMPNFIDAGTDRRLDVFAALRVGKSLPIAPSLNHEKSSNLLKKSDPRQVIIRSAGSTGAVDKWLIAAAIWRLVNSCICGNGAINDLNQCPGRTITFGFAGRLVFDTTSDGTCAISTSQSCRTR